MVTAKENPGCLAMIGVINSVVTNRRQPSLCKNRGLWKNENIFPGEIEHPRVDILLCVNMYAQEVDEHGLGVYTNKTRAQIKRRQDSRACIVGVRKHIRPSHKAAATEAAAVAQEEEEIEEE